MLLKRQGQLIWIARLRSFSVTERCQEFGNLVLQQHPRSIRTYLGCRQTLLADHAQHRRICDVHERRHFTDGQFTSSFPFAFAIDLDLVMITRSAHTLGIPALAVRGTTTHAIEDRSDHWVGL